MSSYWHRSVIIWFSMISFKLAVRFRIKYCSDWPVFRSSVEVFFSRLTDFFCFNSLLSKENTLGLTPSRHIQRRQSVWEQTTRSGMWDLQSGRVAGLFVYDARPPIKRFRLAPLCVLAPRAAGPRDWHVFDPWSNALRCHAGTPAAASTVSVCKLFKTGFIVGMFALDRATLGNRESKGFCWIVLGIRAELFEQTRAT